MASMISSAVAPCWRAALVCPRMQYGHCVTCATATAINCLVLAGSAPSANTLRLNALKASTGLGARRLRSSASSLVACGYTCSCSDMTRNSSHSWLVRAGGGFLLSDEPEQRLLRLGELLDGFLHQDALQRRHVHLPVDLADDARRRHLVDLPRVGLRGFLHGFV